MIDYKKYINALRKCAKEHDNDRTSTGHIIVSDLCRDTANLLESLTLDFVVLPKISLDKRSASLDLSTCDDMGEVSDGYHTFNQLYHQRAILFATIVNNFKSHAWKSLKHEDGKYCFDSNGKWFIVGVDTPEGSYTYHYETDKYWDIFDCEVLECGKHWDGHTEDDVTRLLSLTQYNTINDIK